MDRNLSTLEVRVLGALLEKELTTPDQYPLSLNALMLACNQKSNRDPVMDLDEGTVQQTLDALSARRVVKAETGHGSRVSKYRHRFCNTEFGELKLSPQALGIIITLFLRGPQTPGEMRTRTQRLCEFRDVSQVESCLNELKSRETEPLVRQLPREPGKRESRFVHLFSDQSALPESDEHGHDVADHTHDGGGLAARVATLEAQVATLQLQIAQLQAAPEAASSE